MYRRILGFHRRVWWPKWTPDSRSCRRVTTGMMDEPPFGCRLRPVPLRLHPLSAGPGDRSPDVCIRPSGRWASLADGLDYLRFPFRERLLVVPPFFAVLFPVFVAPDALLLAVWGVFVAAFFRAARPARRPRPRPA